MSPSAFLAAGNDRRAAIAVGIVVLVLAACEAAGPYAPSTWIQRDGRFYVNMGTTLLESGSLEQPFAASWYTGTLGWNRELDVGWSNIALGGHGEYYPKHTWVLPLLSLPLLLAFGLLGTLVFTALVYGAAAAFSYRFARAYAGPAASALAVITLLYATSMREQMYDYQADPVILALGVAAMACAAESRGAVAGILLGMVVLMRPTALMVIPPVAFVLIERSAALGERAAWRTLGRAVLAGAAVLAVGALVNWWMFGRPWLSGYNRILAVVNGTPQVVDNAASFSTPFEAGLRRMWSGTYGLRRCMPVMALAAPGLLWLLVRRPSYALSAIALGAGSVLVFAKYAFEGHRFHWLALAFLLPALATSFELTARVAERVRRLRHASLAAPIALFAIALGVLLLASAGASDGASLEDGGVLARIVLSAILAAATCAALARVAEPAVAGAVALALLLLPAARGTLLFQTDGALGGGLAPAICAALAVALLALGPRGRTRAAWLSGAAAALLAGGAAWLVLADAARAVELSATHVLPDLAALRETLHSPGAARSFAPLLLLTVPGVLVALRKDLRTGSALVVLLAALLPAAHPTPTSPLVALALALPLAALASASGAALARLRGHSVGAFVAVCVVALVLAGLARRSAEAAAPFRIASARAVRLAEVWAGNIPCDFLAWEHQSWECSHVDAGLYQLTGLATSDPPRVGGARIPLFVISTAASQRIRTVAWRGVRGGRALVLDWAVPEGQRGGVEVDVWVDAVAVDSFEVPVGPTTQLETRTIDTASAQGRDVTLRITVRSRGPVGLVALDGGFND